VDIIQVVKQCVDKENVLITIITNQIQPVYIMGYFFISFVAVYQRALLITIVLSVDRERENRGKRTKCGKQKNYSFDRVPMANSTAYQS